MKKDHYLFTSESVSEGHPDKIADQISDRILDQFLAFDPEAHVAAETLVTTGQVIIVGEVKSKTYVDVQNIARETIKDIGYTKDDLYFSYKSLGVLTSIHDQSEDIAQGVIREEGEQGAGDQGMMFGYAVDETEELMPLPIAMAHKIMEIIAYIRKHTQEMPYLRPDGKSQVTVEYNGEHRPVGIHTIVVSVQHDEFIKPSAPTKEAEKEAERLMQARIKEDILKYVFPRLKEAFAGKVAEMLDRFDPARLLVNPTGKFIIGGPHGDSGLTGRKIIVDTYGGRGAHGGGAFSGKDPSKVDRSAAYAVRHLAKNMVAAGVAREILIQVSYAIGVAEPINIYVNTYGTSRVPMTDAEIGEILLKHFRLTPQAIEDRLKLREPIYGETAAYGHFGRKPRKKVKVFKRYNYALKREEILRKEVELFTWEKLDLVDQIKDIFFNR
ncbi:MAG: methionine adenosyltransferase [Chlorobi bacterium]|nr:methionine adenosyltransferase [Chlorobiota bacterium]